MVTHGATLFTDRFKGLDRLIGGRIYLPVLAL